MFTMPFTIENEYILPHVIQSFTLKQPYAYHVLFGYNKQLFYGFRVLRPIRTHVIFFLNFFFNYFNRYYTNNSSLSIFCMYKHALYTCYFTNRNIVMYISPLGMQRQMHAACM